MNRSLKLSMMLALALGSGHAAALELGQIQIKSALGQPLVAEIPIRPDHPGELDHLTAQLAAAEDFSRAGVTAPSVLLQFAVVDGGNGAKVVRVTSSAPVNDPFLDLLVELNTGRSKSTREFTVLLDPPGMSSQQAPAVSAPASHARAAAPAPARSTRAAAAPAPAPAPSRHAAAPAAGEQVTVERGQTLSAIAKRNAPSGVDLNQVMLAYKQNNPDAFFRDNINALKTGAVLRVPTAEQAQATTAAAALAEIRRQNSDWRGGAARTPTSVADAGTRSEATTSPTRGGHDDRLALVPAKEGAEAGKGGNAGLRQDLQRSQEQLASLQQQSGELKSRLKDLEDINGKNERLLALKDNQIAELQRKLAEARKGAPATAASTTTPAAAVPVATPAAKSATPAPTPSPVTPPAAATAHAPASTPPAASSGATPAHAGSAHPVASPAPAPAKPVAKPASKPAAPAPVEEAPWFMQPWAWGVGAGVLVLLILLALLRRRRAATAVPVAAAAAGGSSLADRFGDPKLGPEDLDQEELLDQLAEHPDDIGLHLELVSLYYSRRDVEHFEAAAEAMHAHITDPQQAEWQDVVHMGEDLVPNHPLFAPRSDSHMLADDERIALHHFDLDQYAAASEPLEPPPIPASAVPPPIPGGNKVSEYHFDFDLSPQPIPPVAAEPHHELEDIHEAALPPLPEVEEENHTSWEFAEDALLDEPVTLPHDASVHTPSFEPETSLHEPAHVAAPAHNDFSHGEDFASHELGGHDLGGFSDDPVDTKLDLARAYLDMGDPDGARAMLEEVLHEGSQMQKDTAQRLLQDLR